MKSLVVSVALVAAGTIAANAQDRTIVEDRPAITVPVPVPNRGVVIEKRNRPIEERRTTVETTGRGGCESKTVHKEGVEGSTTIKKERCD